MGACLRDRFVGLSEPRKGDESYALRIVIDQLILGAGARDSETGAGIDLECVTEDEYNNDEPSVIIDLPSLTVEVRGTHVGLAQNRSVAHAVLDRLAMPLGQWTHFVPHPQHAHHYRFHRGPEAAAVLDGR